MSFDIQSDGEDVIISGTKARIDALDLFMRNECERIGRLMAGEIDPSEAGGSREPLSTLLIEGMSKEEAEKCLAEFEREQSGAPEAPGEGDGK